MKVTARGGATHSRTIRLWGAFSLLAGPGSLALSPPAPAILPAAGTTIYVNGETGYDCYDGLAPRPDDLCLPPPEPAVPGPFKTITKALTTIAQNPAIGSGPPYTVRVAARFHEGIGAQYVYGYSPSAVNYTGETFPLLVPPRTLLRADAANSELAPGRRVIIEGPVPPATNAVDTLQFLAGGTDNFTSEGGLDGTEIPDYGIEVRRGGRSVFLEANGLLGPRWPTIPPGPSPPVPPAMSIRIERVWFSGGAAYALDAHIETKGTGDFTVLNCQFTTAITVFVDPLSAPVGQPVPHAQHTGQALIHVYGVGDPPPPTPGALTFLTPRFADNLLTVLPGPGGVLPDVEWGMVLEPWFYTESDIQVTGLALDGAASPGVPGRGIAVGIELASNTMGGSPLPGAPGAGIFTLTGSDVRNCRVFGLALATGVWSGIYAPPTATVTRLNVSANRITGNGLVPDDPFPSISTHFEFPGAGIHMVRRPAGGSEFVGGIASNTITDNRIGIAYSAGGVPLGPVGGFSISGNTISGQDLYPPGYVPPPFSFVGADGVGMIVGDDTPGGLSFGGDLSPTFVVESNRVFDNSSHGIWLAKWWSVSNLAPLLRNNRTYQNAADGVHISLGPGVTGPGQLEPTLVHETVVFHGNGYGVNNVPGIGSAISRPVIWNSIVYSNAGAPGAPDLSGFSFPPFATGGLVNFSDFCGLPWAVACGTVPSINPPIAGCVNADPVFVAPGPPGFNLSCATGGSPCPGGCASICISPCIDAASPTGPGSPLMPVIDGTGADRTVSLNQPCPATEPPDMGAIEKQGCTP
jgi:hypothetical protein